MLLLIYLSAVIQDYSLQPPAQELIAKDLHDNDWKFRHIFRGTFFVLSSFKIDHSNIAVSSKTCLFSCSACITAHALLERVSTFFDNHVFPLIFIFIMHFH